MGDDCDAAQSIGYLGPEASYTHQAALTLAANTRTAYVRKRSIHDVFDAVQSFSVELGIVPFENSSNGTVDATLDCLIDRASEYEDVCIVEQVEIDVQHSLLGPLCSREDQSEDNSSTVQGLHERDLAAMTRKIPNFSKITDVYSHPQALGQCRAFLAQVLPNADLHEVPSTSEAASIVTHKSDIRHVAISSKLAAERYKLDILATDIQDQKDNKTRFVVLCRRGHDIKPRRETFEQGWQTLTRFNICHELPGALESALRAYSIASLNLISINSRPSRMRPWHYTFLVGSECQDPATDMAHQLEKLHEELGKVAEGYKSLGSWRIS